jgi:hypothetical protein
MLQDSSPEYSEPVSDDNFEETILLEDFLRQARRARVLSAAQYKLLLKFKYEGFVWKELAEGDGGPSAIALYRRVKRTIYRLRRARRGEADGKSRAQAPSFDARPSQSQKNISQQAVDFSEEMPFSNSEKEFLPELSHPVPQVESDNAQFVA